MNGFNPEGTKIMVVDDSVTTLKSAKVALSELGDVFTLPSATRLFEILETVDASLILLDIFMPGMNGLETIKLLKADPRYRDIPVIFLTAISGQDSEFMGLNLGAADYITKPFNPDLLRKRVEIQLTISAQKKALEQQSRLLTIYNEDLQKMVLGEMEKVNRLQNKILDTMVDMVESRDKLPASHIRQTINWLGILVNGLKESGLYTDIIEPWDLAVFLQSARLHDVGKISISDRILKKPGKLDVDEFEAVKLHTTFGARIIDEISQGLSEMENSYFEQARVMALTHHEKWDGTGYPNGLAGQNIPLEGRLMAITDVYTALVSDKPYKDPLQHSQAVEIILAGSGTHFDPVLVSVFNNIQEQFTAVRGDLTEQKAE
ncbi:MAG: response regulator [Deltaproteobacteria bacterium]|nr:response regulator [Deltaproteobacteria bacterium]